MKLNLLLEQVKNYLEIVFYRLNKKILIVTSLLISITVCGQTQPVEFKRSGDRKIQGINIIKKMDNVSLIQTTVLFQNVTKKGIFVNERGVFGGAATHGASMSAELTAYLVFSDGEPSDEEYQKVVDGFYTRLNEKLNQSNIKALSWEKFTSSKYYNSAKGEKEEDKNTQDMMKRGNAWKVFTANKGPRIIRYNPMNHNYNAPAVGGTVKLANYLKEVKASTAAALNIVVNFADIYLEGEAHSGRTERAFSTVNWQSSKVKYDLYPNIRVTGRHSGGNQIFIFPTSKAFDEIFNTTDIRATTDLKAETSQDEAKIKKRSWLVPQISIGHKHNITPFVVETTKKEYFDNVKNALDRYADELAKALKNAKQ